jgi:hypothetical protein
MIRAANIGCAALVAAALSGCASCQPRPPESEQQWSEADPLFHQDPKWLGGDAAFSVPLEDGRVLWLFGDTFISTGPANVRSRSKMVRNTVGIQSGSLDPSAATMKFHWRGDTSAPSSFFPEETDLWYWPAHGIRLGSALVVFCQRIKSTGEGGAFGFVSDGWSLALIDDASGEPSSWTVRMLRPTSAPSGIALGSAVNLVGEQVVVLGEREPGDHAGFLARWTKADLLAGRVDAAEWFTADRGWIAQSALAGAQPSTVMANAGPESSLHFDAEKAKWVHIRSEGFGSTTIVRSEAAAPEGPWSTPEVIFRPPESDREGILVYAAKAHPELSAGSELAVTYATNSTDLATLVRDTSIYFPRFVRVPR